MFVSCTLNNPASRGLSTLSQHNNEVHCKVYVLRRKFRGWIVFNSTLIFGNKLSAKCSKINIRLRREGKTGTDGDVCSAQTAEINSEPHQKGCADVK